MVLNNFRIRMETPFQLAVHRVEMFGNSVASSRDAVVVILRKPD